MSENINAISLAEFDQYVTELKQIMKRQYDRSINKDLSRQQWQGLFKRNVISALKQVYEDALGRLIQLSFDPEGIEAVKEVAELTALVLQPFDGFVDEFVQYALQKHRTSCALSNFPDEHKPSRDYIAEVLLETSEDWQAFASQVHAMMFRRAFSQ